ncbi:hypothetical protein MCOR24_003923 [Pyricularia oryzae]|nr:hypothetical protein MCOR24_003923 [Pyricularia oryzae]
MELAQLAYYAAGYQGERGAKRREYFGTDNPADIAVIQQDVLLLHEMTHLASIKLTADYGIHDHEDLRKLSRKQKLNHANTYAYFAHCVRAGC